MGDIRRRGEGNVLASSAHAAYERRRHVKQADTGNARQHAQEKMVGLTGFEPATP